MSLFDWSAGRRRAIDLNQGGFHDSYTGDLALDAERGILYVVDQANFRVAVIERGRGRWWLGARGPPAVCAGALAGPQKALRHQRGDVRVPPDPRRRPGPAAATGLPFPAFGFPSARGRSGAERQTAKGPVQVPGLGDPNVRESNSLCVVDVSNPAAPRWKPSCAPACPSAATAPAAAAPREWWLPATASSSPTRQRQHHRDRRQNATRSTAEIPIRIPGLETLRGVLPIGMAYHEKTRLAAGGRGGHQRRRR